MSTMPAQKPGKSKQDVGTPDWLLKLVGDTWGPIVYDPAASETNHACANYDTISTDGLSQNWQERIGDFNLYDLEDTPIRFEGCVWINPPFRKIRPWVEKAWLESQGHHLTIVMLVPAAVGSNWWADYVDGKAEVYFIRPRLVFKGHSDSYPKDCALVVFGAGLPKYRCVYATKDSTSLDQEPGLDN